MLITISNNFGFSLLIQKEKDKENFKMAKMFLALSLMINLGVLGFFKYYDFLIANINSLLSTQLVAHNLPLPIGISFYTFQSMSYTIDVYRGDVKAQRSFLILGTYVTLFPQLIAGPIVRYSTVEDELENRKESISLAAKGLRRFIIGLGKKVIIANQMGFIADTIFNNTFSRPGTILTWLALICYTFQIYYDFSGYSDMAIGLGHILGFNFLENFNYPYISKSITEFWRRWHISLSTWFRDYLYIPLGGNRSNAIRNILIVWFLTGLWHGASWNFILWGLYYGVLLLIEKHLLKDILPKFPNVFKHIYAIFFILIGWSLFRIEDLSQLVKVLRTLFIYESTSLRTVLLDYQDIFYSLPYIILAIIGSTPIVKNTIESFEKKSSTAGYILNDLYYVCIICVSIMFLIGDTFNPFIYFKF
ncbi:MAG: MBOAT family O-acyltransferase [Tissierellaceae bacterium]|nr:MBOAT family O-acyltransferase [Tissierellaceae bacterium]